MDYLTVDDLKNLSGRNPGWCVSLYMPVHRAGEDTKQDPIRLKNLLDEAGDRLSQKGLRTPEVNAIIEPAQKLLLDPSFWWDQSDGLAVFLSADGMQTYRLPIRFNELLVISDRFHLKPLIPFIASDGHFYMLGLSQNQVRLFEGTRYTVDEIQLENLPESIAEALQYDRYEKSLQFHTRTGTTDSSGRRPAAYHGHSPEDDEKGRLLRWFHKVDDELIKFLAGEQAPLVLAGVEYYFPLFRDASDYPNILKQGVSGSPDRLRPEEIHAQAWPLVEPIFTQAEKDAADRYHQMAAQGKALSDVEQAVQAADRGRVETLFVPVGLQIWGKVDPQKGEIVIHTEEQPGDEDLLDLAAVHTLANRGEVYAVPQNQMPVNGPVAAILRY